MPRHTTTTNTILKPLLLAAVFGVVILAAFSPVPGGIGPVTISMLLENLVEAAKGIEI